MASVLSSALVISPTILLLLYPYLLPATIPTSVVLFLVFILGALSPTLISSFTTRIIKKLEGEPAPCSNDKNHILAGGIDMSSDLYGLDHAILNVRSLVAETMWMNMGYWKDTPNMIEACEALVEKVLQNAGLTQTKPTTGEQNTPERDDEPENNRSRRKGVLLDLGFGCGEQTLYLMNRKDTPFERYIGITIDKLQYAFAKTRTEAAAQPKYREKKMQTDIFCADAGNPSSWPDDLQKCVSAAFGGGDDGTADNSNPQPERYVLGLDSLYHFRPSREAIFKYSHSVLNAHFLAFDIFLAPPGKFTWKSLLNRCFLRILTPSLQAPFSNFVTIPAYAAQLRDAGYAGEDITIEDITDDVFAGLAGFLEQRQRELEALGLSGFSKWRISGWLFRWLASGDVLRAGIVVAKWKPNYS